MLFYYVLLLWATVTCLCAYIFGAGLVVAALALAGHALTVLPTVFGRRGWAGSVSLSEPSSTLHVTLWPCCPQGPVTINYTNREDSVREVLNTDVNVWSRENRPWHARGKQARLSNWDPPQAPPGRASLNISLCRKREPRPHDTLHWLHGVHWDIMQSTKREQSATIVWVCRTIFTFYLTYGSLLSLPQSLSSEPSTQSLCRSHLRSKWTHSPLLHKNCFGEHGLGTRGRIGVTGGVAVVPYKNKERSSENTVYIYWVLSLLVHLVNLATLNHIYYFLKLCLLPSTNCRYIPQCFSSDPSTQSFLPSHTWAESTQPNEWQANCPSTQITLGWPPSWVVEVIHGAVNMTAAQQ